MFNRRTLLVSTAAALGALSTRTAFAQSFPSRPVTIVVPYAAGGATDVIARLLARHLQPRLGGAVVVENRPGATTAIGTQHVARAAPDGHTLLMTAPPLVIGHYATPKPPYDAMKDLAPISLVTVSPLVLAVSPKVAASSIAAFLAFARANPGKLNYGSTGNMGLPHLAAELLCKQAGLTMTHVPYRGGGQVATDLLSGQVDLYLGNPVEITPLLSQGIKALAVTTGKRFALMPDLPTMSEAGVAGYDLSTWTGLLAPAGTDPALLAKLNAETSAILALPEVVKNLNDQFSAPEGGSIDRFRGFLALQHEVIGNVVQLL